MNRNWLRYVSLLLFLALQCFLLLGILLATRVNTDSVLRGHTEEIMSHVVSSVSNRTRALLEPAERSISLSHTLLQTEQINALDNLALEKYFLSQLQTYKQYAGMYLGRPDGSFVFVQRDTSFTTTEDIQSSYRTKIIQTKPERTVELIFQDSNGTILHREFDLEDSYDPRHRLWYEEARAKVTPNDPSDALKPMIWTEPYIFFSSKKPGITVASTIESTTGQSTSGQSTSGQLNRGTELGTIGIDIELSDLSHYLEMIASEEKNSFAFLQTIDNSVVGFPEFDAYMKNEEAKSLPQISDIQNKASKAFLSAEVEQNSLPYLPFNFIQSPTNLVDFEVDKMSYIGTLQSISVVEGQHWLLGILAPKETFTGNIMNRYQQNLWQILALGLLCSLIAIPLSFGISRPLNRLHRQATTDALTGLFDRSQFIRQSRRLEAKAKRSKKNIAYVMMDLDNFKPINDVYGHSVGDEVLVIVAKRLQDAVKAKDLVARFGGDEFALCLYDIEAKSLAALIERIRNTVEGDGVTSSQGFHKVGVTAGVILSKAGVTPETSLSFADRALVQGKVIRKGRSYVSDGRINTSKTVQKRVSLTQTNVDVLTTNHEEDIVYTDSAY